MKTSMPTIIEIENENDVQTYRDSTGFIFPVGTFVVSGILNDTPEGIRPFFSSDDALAYIAEKICNAKPSEPAKKSAKKAAKAVSTKKPAKPKAKKESLLAKENKKMAAKVKAKRAAKKNK